MMLSDAGYGIIMSLLAGYALQFKLAGSGKKFGHVIPLRHIYGNMGCNLWWLVR